MNNNVHPKSLFSQPPNSHWKCRKNVSDSHHRPGFSHVPHGNVDQRESRTNWHNGHVKSLSVVVTTDYSDDVMCVRSHLANFNAWWNSHKNFEVENYTPINIPNRVQSNLVVGSYLWCWWHLRVFGKERSCPLRNMVSNNSKQVGNVGTKIVETPVIKLVLNYLSHKPNGWVLVVEVKTVERTSHETLQKKTANQKWYTTGKVSWYELTHHQWFKNVHDGFLVDINLF